MGQLVWPVGVASGADALVGLWRLDRSPRRDRGGLVQGLFLRDRVIGDPAPRNGMGNPGGLGFTTRPAARGGAKQAVGVRFILSPCSSSMTPATTTASGASFPRQQTTR